MKTTWRRNIIQEMERYGEKLSDIVSSTMTFGEMDTEFDSAYGETEGIPFTIWTKNRVYFPATNDGMEWVASVSRNPDGNPTKHIGA